MTIPPGFELRPIQSQDMDFLCHLYGSTREEELAQVDWPSAQKDAFVRMQFEAQHAHYQQHYPNANFDVIVYEGKDIGRMYIDRHPKEIRLMEITLRPTQRNKGLGTRLMDWLMDEAAQTDKILTLHVEEFNPAYRLYQRLGFKPLEQRGVYMFMEWKPE